MVLDKFSLAGQVAIVTGGGQGLGRVFCQAFAEAGAAVVVAEMNPATGPAAAAELREQGHRAISIQTDVRQQSSIQAMVEQTLAEFGQIDILMNNAGIVKWGAAEDVTEEDWREVIEVNLSGVFFCSQAVGRHMIQRRTGRIISIASMSGYIVNHPQAQASYNISKAGVVHLTKSLASEWARYNIRVNAIAPGYMGTPMAKPYFDTPGIGDVWMENIPMKRPGEPAELGPVAVFLASEASSYMTGEVVVVDGGYTIW